ncbi:unnamed protein product (mitochondrion) [Plasmodiophora brassicae]|uniref:N-acetyltransferase domain-containing protein n=1 Tax=Plasmodiophora brassicae TaxID=37360 RepID=A0A0G4IRW8_PLABS|nr:hypothetical protein PBRA_005965 [Plasmodiophora brassicae]SPQ98071.1 unnamed protein product [Plasmodiophora brassicae]
MRDDVVMPRIVSCIRRHRLLTSLVAVGVGASCLWRLRRWLLAFLFRRYLSSAGGTPTQKASSPPKAQSATSADFDIPRRLLLTTSLGCTMVSTAEVTSAHLQQLHELLHRPKSSLVHLRSLPLLTPREIHIRTRTMSTQQSECKCLMFFVVRGNELVGTIGFVRLDAVTCSGEMDVTALSDWWDDGGVEDMFLAVLEYGFEQLRLQRVLCGVDRQHRPPRAFFERFDWQLVSVGRAGFPNMYNFMLSSEDWGAHKARLLDSLRDRCSNNQADAATS